MSEENNMKDKESKAVVEMTGIEWFRQLPISDEDMKILFAIMKEIVANSQAVVSQTILDLIFPTETPNKTKCMDIIQQWISNYTTKTIDELYTSVKKED